MVRHVTGDRIVAMVEVVSPGNESSRQAIEAFARKAAELFDQGIQLLVLDLHPPGPRDSSGIHGVIWDEITGQPFSLSAEKPLTLAAYEVDLSVRAYVHTLAVGETLIDMPLFLRPREHVLVPLERTYQAAFQAVPRR